MTEKISILGSTGSIGTQSLDVAEKRGYEVIALTANSNVNIIEEQIRKYKPKMAAMVDETAAKQLKDRVADTDTKVLCGMSGVCECAAAEQADTVINSVVGMAGLEPTLCAIKAKKKIALANKETLVAGGSLVTKTAKEYGVDILPVDSEHSAIFQCLQGMNKKEELKSIILTASGGPFFGKTADELKNVTVAQALKHPNWSMGAKITIDSASMMNKGLELIEAVWLFDVAPSMVDIVVHRESVVHSLIEYVDNSVIAQLGVPDMRIPIQYALTYPDRFESPVKKLSLSDYATLTFSKPDYDTFKCINICRSAIEKGGLYPAIANGANEAANLLFRQGKIGFLDIASLVEKAVENGKSIQNYTLDDVLNADAAAREFVISQL
ncbi:MAG: 1-deoxy-D-xylulose-5-phosphate reductoisomerase [Faecalibacterium sp.]|nr:1-deoxy-D-xylulose-5-phosphate reductoisomerase [Ruminococcus sp.]MCM1392004.1 1-deoxy-D-xylulose-5-phosphate reductoisomerase [Ruminococcus sp.]MCM1485736.1 1-deoxy-D-xylulose-5-phosphate reductoisomerase [Faecalibacterium sp.]